MKRSGTPLEIAREAYRSISLYAPNRAPAAIDLSDNTNLWGVPPQAARAIHEAASATITRYPPLYVSDVKQVLAEYLGVPETMVVTGCGSDDVLDMTMRAFGEPGDLVLHPDPSFAMIPTFAKMNGLRPLALPLTSSFDADADAFLATLAKVIYLCSPNNPTGATFTRATIERIVDGAAGVVIIDEAYAEFAGTNCLDLLQRSSRVVITRTMSKAFGLAGARVGYAIGDPALVREIEKSRGPYKVNAIAAQAVVAAVREDVAWVQAHIQEAVDNRRRLSDALHTLGLAPLPSDANFVLVPVSDGGRIDHALRERGVAVRAFTKLPGIGDALRISVGPWEMLETALRTLEEVLKVPREEHRVDRGGGQR